MHSPEDRPVSSALPPEAYRLPLRQVLGVCFGNALEFYDFLIFSFFAIQISNVYFPKEQTSHGLLFSLAMFGMGFVTRPIGALVIGRYGDRAGRKAGMIVSFTLMGMAILGLGLTPSYAHIGIVAPLLLLFFRLVQGFAVGGEVGPSTAFLVEIAPPNRRGLYVAMQTASQGVAILASGIIGFTLSSLLSPESLDAWGWRVAFLLGTVVIPVGLYIRNRLPETLRNTVRSSVDSPDEGMPFRALLLGLIMLGAITIVTYGRIFLTTYGQDVLKLPARIAFGATVINGLCALLVCPLSGLLSDKLGRKPVMIGGSVMLIAMTTPSFLVLSRWPSIPVFFAVAFVMSTVGWMPTVPVTTLIAESMPPAIRSGAIATLYAGAIALFGGSSQFILKWIADATGNTQAPSWYLTAALVAGLCAMFASHEPPLPK